MFKFAAVSVRPSALDAQKSRSNALYSLVPTRARLRQITKALPGRAQVGYTCVWMALCSELNTFRKLYGPSVLLKMNIVSSYAQLRDGLAICIRCDGWTAADACG